MWKGPHRFHHKLGGPMQSRPESQKYQGPGQIAPWPIAGLTWYGTSVAWLGAAAQRNNN